MTITREFGLALAELSAYRELFWFLAWRDIKVRYKQAVFGAGWALVQPLVSMIVFATVFRGLVGTTPADVPYPLFVYCGLVPWTYFSTTLTRAGNSLVSNSNLITKVYFPRMLLPASSALASLVDFLIASAFMVVLMAYYGIRPTRALIFYPIVMTGMWVITLGMGMWLAALNVRYRDVTHAIPFLTQLGLFVTPVIYPSTMMPPWLRQLLVLNPLAGIIEGFRACLFPQYPVDFYVIAGSAMTGTVVFVASAFYFRRTERAFADIV